MANFKIAENGLDISYFHLPLNRTIKLLQWGGDIQGKKLEVVLNKPSLADLTVLPDKLPAASTAFTVKGKSEGMTIIASAYVPGSGCTQKYSEDLTLYIGGNPTKQPGYDVDLLSNLAIHGNAKQIHTYSQIIKGPDNDKHILSQDTRKGHYNCFTTAAAYGLKFFGKPTHTASFLYYLPPPHDQSNEMEELQFNAELIKTGVARIKALVSQGIPVMLMAIHHGGFAKVIQNNEKTHFLTVIGYSANKFLYLDPWPNGSKLEYNGGMYYADTNSFIGELSFDLGNPSNGINSPEFPKQGKGSHRYRIIAGP